MTTQRNAKPRVGQKRLAVAALAVTAAFAFVPVGQSPLMAHTQGDTVYAADSSRSLVAR
jgi:hypothetical protein